MSVVHSDNHLQIIIYENYYINVPICQKQAHTTIFGVKYTNMKKYEKEKYINSHIDTFTWEYGLFFDKNPNHNTPL